ncbi:MAG: calcium-binding protein [Candidatus Peregrinibacteria bacterium]|nr:calcium-binding protein [Candidatus Peregrinibacteria bacterium]
MHLTRSTVALLSIGLLLSSSAPTLEAQAITTLTLVSGNGPIGGLDPITEFSINGTTWTPATIVPACCQLGQSIVNYDVIPGTQLIARNNSGTTPTTPTTLYRVSFQLPPSFLVPVLKITMHADNMGTVFLNGNLVGAQPGNPNPVSANFKDPPSIFVDAVSAHFQPGQNEIRFNVLNFGGPSILDYEAQITYVASPPPAGTNPCLNPTITGTAGNDAIVLTTGPHVVDGMGGNDAIVSIGNFNDIICGGTGDDRIDSGGGNDIVFAGPGDDAVSGNAGNDALLGGPGDDTLHGDTGFDICFDFQGTNTFSQCP